MKSYFYSQGFHWQQYLFNNAEGITLFQFSLSWFTHEVQMQVEQTQVHAQANTLMNYH